MKNKSLNMKRIAYLRLALIALFLSFQVEFYAQSRIEKIASDRIYITIDNVSDESISILQLTDLHLGSKGKWKDDINTFRRINRLVEMYDPDLLALTGDVFAGKKMADIDLKTDKVQPILEAVDRTGTLPSVFYFNN